MFTYTLPLVLALASTASSLQERLSIPNYSAASESQIKFAIENNYDDTGPGAKSPEYAYNTYKTLEEALVSYIDDPDTKLPESERMKAIIRLVNTPKSGYDRYNPSQPIREYPKSVAEYTGYRQIPQISPIVLKKQQVWPEKPVLYQDPRENLGVYNFRGISLSNGNAVVPRDRPQSLYKLENVQIPGQVKSIAPQNYYPYLTKFIPSQEHFDAVPQYSNAYGIRNKWQGDARSPYSSRVEGPVRGYYTYTGPDGRQRTLHYTDDQLSARSHARIQASKQ